MLQGLPMQYKGKMQITMEFDKGCKKRAINCVSVLVQILARIIIA